MPARQNTTIRAFATVTLQEALGHFDDLDQHSGVIPPHARNAINRDLKTLFGSADALGMRTLADLCTDVANLLQHATGLAKVTGPHRTADAEQLHRYRNVALALALASGYYLHVDAPSVIGHFPTLWPRTQRTDRPHKDDEILVLRVRIIDLMRRQSRYKLAGVYAMVDAGATPAETTGITASDFDDNADGDEPTYMLIPKQNNFIDDRGVELDQFAARVLGRVIGAAATRRLATTEPLTYTSTTGGRYSPSASVSRMLDRLADELGIKAPDVTAASTRRWRIQTTFDMRGIDAAADIAGESAARLRKLIHLPEAPEDLDAAPAVRGFCN